MRLKVLKQPAYRFAIVMPASAQFVERLANQPVFFGTLAPTRGLIDGGRLKADVHQ